MISPYWGTHFFTFIWTFLSRLPFVILGKSEWMQDELQILALVLMSISCALLGVILVLRKMTMLANSLSHTILLGIVLAYVFSFSTEGFSPFSLNITKFLMASFIVALITTFLSEFLTKTLNLQEDASIGLVFTFLFSIGVILVTILARNAHIGAEIVMGNIDALVFNDLKPLFLIATLNIFLFTVFYRQYVLTTFDPCFAKLIKVSGVFFNYLIMLQLSVTVVGSFRIVGVILVLSYIVTPALIARLFFHRFCHLLFASVFISAITSFLSVALSRHFLSVYQMPLSTAGICVTLLSTVYIGSLILKGKKWKSQYSDQPAP